MKNILVKAYMEKNFGDDLFLKILFERYKKTNWIMDTTNRDYESIFSNYDNASIINSFIYKILRKLKKQSIFYSKYDGVIYIGGSIFMQLDIWEQQYNDRKRIFKVFKNKPKFIIGSNFGPFKEESFFKVYKELLRKCTDVCFRDEYSYNLFKDLDNVRIASDIVFQLKPKNVEKVKNSIGISLINLDNRSKLNQYNYEYKNRIKEMVEYLIENGKNITFFSFCELEGDLQVINEVVSLINSKYNKSISVQDYTGNIDEFLSKFESMENIIGTRFHSCILSQIFGQGLYPLIYSDKTYNVLKDINLDKEYMYIKDIDILNPKHILEVINDNKIHDKNIFKKSEKHFEIMDKYLKK